MVTRIKRARTTNPNSSPKAEGLLESIGEQQAEINRINQEAKEKIDAIRMEANKKIAKLTKVRNRLFNALWAYAILRKKQLTSTHRTVRTLVGKFGWRWTPYFVKIAERETEASIIARLEELGLTQYLRVVVSIDREALLRDRAFVPCIRYAQEDEFFAVPKLPEGAGHTEKLTRTEVVDV